MKKIKVGIFFGGRSTEHEISILSANNIVKNIDKNKYEILLIGIDKNGKFHFEKNSIIKNLPGSNVLFQNSDLNFCEKFPSEINEHLSEYMDIAFPVLHGYLGEDGAIQGLLKIFNIPFVGPDVLSSAMCMDKEVAKILLKENGIAVSNYIALRKPEKISYQDVSKKLGETVFVKPSSSGSSVGVSKVTNEKEFESAISEAYEYDNKILIEEAINGREIECAVIGNENPKTSNVCGEIIPTKDFYSYEAKYIDENGAVLEIPAKVSPEIMQKLKDTALRAYKTLNCEGMSRVDMFLVDDSKIILNEINTIPGCTEISMFPALLKYSGMSYTEIIDNLLNFAFEKQKRADQLKRSK